MTATEKWSMHPRQRRHDRQHRLGTNRTLRENAGALGESVTLALVATGGMIRFGKLVTR
jgi:hypothetical protein